MLEFIYLAPLRLFLGLQAVDATCVLGTNHNAVGASMHSPESLWGPKLRDIMGPGLITGASDDDPSGIATYSQAGAQFGYDLGWTLLFTYPLMCAIQLVSAQIGRVRAGPSMSQHGVVRWRRIDQLQVIEARVRRASGRAQRGRGATSFGFSSPVWPPALSAHISSEPQYAEQSAAVLMAAAPPLLIYLLGGRYFVRGLTAGAVK